MTLLPGTEPLGPISTTLLGVVEAWQPVNNSARPESRGLSNVWVYLALLICTFLVYSETRRFDFVNYDDPQDVSHNPHVRNGITAEGFEWAFTSIEAANWFPLTRLSHILDAQVFGLRAGWHHLTNVLLHSFATLLLFAFLHRATGSRWPSAFVAFVFALHPLHVESVAWVTERKDVLSACFWFLALWGYVRYAERPGLGRYLLVLFFFCLGLMSKPMLVTLPFVLLLMDIWPLRRMPLRDLSGSGPRRTVIELVREKVPLFAISAAGAIATYIVQQRGGAMGLPWTIGIGLRLENALVSYVAYLGQVFWPSRLAVFYPFPQIVPAWQALMASLVIAAVSTFVLRRFRTYPYLAVGWLWYLGTLIPVIGLVQVGAQARADRYMYLPLVGISIMLSWAAEDLVRLWPRAKAVVAISAVMVCASCVAVTAMQLRYWRDSESLFQHALAVTNGNYIAESNLGGYFVELNERLPEAVTHLEAALRIRPDFPEAYVSLGLALSEMGQLTNGIAQLEAAVKLKPDSAVAHNNLGNALGKIPARLPEAIAEYRAALQISLDYPEAHNDLGAALSRVPGRLPEAIQEYETAIRIEHDYPEAHNNLGFAFLGIPGHSAEAISECEAALRLKPNYPEAHNTLGYRPLANTRPAARGDFALSGGTPDQTQFSGSAVQSWKCIDESWPIERSDLPL